MSYQRRAGAHISANSDGVHTSSHMTGVSRFYPETAPSLALFVPNAVVHLRICLPVCASTAVGLLSLSPAPSIGAGPAFSLQLHFRPSNSSVQSYPPSPGILPTALQRLYLTEPLLCRCCPSYRRLNAVVPWCAQ
jgi:hypothetical protein